MTAPGSAALVAACVALAGCGDVPLRPSPSEDMTPCGQERPGVCAQVFEPVCGTIPHAHAARWKTYSNACTACADARVEGYRPGACDTD